jgi:hypothetical protein
MVICCLPARPKKGLKPVWLMQQSNGTLAFHESQTGFLLSLDRRLPDMGTVEMDGAQE